MMKAVKNFMNKPMTWGAYTKLCAGSIAFGAIVTLYGYWKCGYLNYMFGKKDKAEAEEYEI